MGYIIAALALLNLTLGGGMVYYKDRYNDAVQFMDKAKEEARVQEEYVKLIKIENKRNIEVLNEKNQLDVNHLNATISRMRQQTNRSIVSTLPTNSNSPGEICFSREKLDNAIQQYRNEILELVGKGTNCQIDLNTAKDWAEFNQNLYNEESNR